MKLKKYVRYEMDFQNRWAEICVAFMGLSLFLRFVYYFALVNLEDVGGGTVFGSLILPLVLSCAFIVLFRVLRWNAPGIYAILGSVFCLLLMIWNFSTGDFLRILMSVIGYIAAASALLATAAGYLPGKLPAALIFTVITVVRLCFYTFDSSDPVSLVNALASASLPMSLTALTLCFKPRVRSADQTEKV